MSESILMEGPNMANGAVVDPSTEAIADIYPANAPSKTVLEIRNLRIVADSATSAPAPGGLPIVDGISLFLEKGKVLGLIGESGAGKSTLGLSSMAFERRWCSVQRQVVIQSLMRRLFNCALRGLATNGFRAGAGEHSVQYGDADRRFCLLSKE